MWTQLGPAEYAIVLAASSAFLMPSDGATSIFGATLTRLSATSLPRERTKSSSLSELGQTCRPWFDLGSGCRPLGLSKNI